MQINWTKWQTVIQVPIFAVMCWATIETCSMRVASEEQTIKNSIPIVVLNFETNGKQGYSKPFVENIGFGPAFNVEISEMENRKFKLKFENIIGIEKDGKRYCNFAVLDSASKGFEFFFSDSTKFDQFINYKGEHFGGRVPGQTFGDITLKYFDVSGKAYETKQSIYFDWIEKRIKSSMLSFPRL